MESDKTLTASIINQVHETYTNALEQKTIDTSMSIYDFFVTGQSTNERAWIENKQLHDILNWCQYTIGYTAKYYYAMSILKGEVNKRLGIEKISKINSKVITEMKDLELDDLEKLGIDSFSTPKIDHNQVRIVLQEYSRIFEMWGKVLFTMDPELRKEVLKSMSMAEVTAFGIRNFLSPWLTIEKIKIIYNKDLSTRGNWYSNTKKEKRDEFIKKIWWRVISNPNLCIEKLVILMKNLEKFDAMRINQAQLTNKWLTVQKMQWLVQNKGYNSIHKIIEKSFGEFLADISWL